MSSSGLRAVEDPPDQLPAGVIEIIMVRASPDGLRYPVLGIVGMGPDAITGRIAGLNIASG